MQGDRYQKAFFKRYKNCGYVLKPEFLRPDSQLSPGALFPTKLKESNVYGSVYRLQVQVTGRRSHLPCVTECGKRACAVESACVCL